MDRRTCLIAVLAIILAASLILETEAAKRRNNQTDDCYKPCRVRSTPVCGNDGRNYTTGCHLSVARCRARKIGQLIYVVNTGFCRSSKPVSQCHLNCTERKAPVCASDMKTYKNLCHFKKAKCEARKRKEPLLSVVNRRGPCLKKAPSACRPIEDCPNVRRHVCGSDNKTYLNICRLKAANCRLKRKAKGKKYKKLTLKYCGACGRGKQCPSAWSQKCPEVKFCDQMLRAAVRYAEMKKAAVSKSLKKNSKSKSKGKTKTVPQLPKQKSSSKPKNKKNIKQRNKKKPTNTKRTKSKKPIPSKNLPKKPNSKSSKKDVKIIPKKMYQVCGSDGKTYPSVCHLQVEQCNKISRCQRLQMKHKGACKKRPEKS